MKTDPNSDAKWMKKREAISAVILAGFASSFPRTREAMNAQLEEWHKTYGDNITIANCMAMDSIALTDALIEELNK